MTKQKQVLYRKYRPQTWDEVYGQDDVVKILRGAIEQGNTGHAYLFSGSRGTGKTSVARIFAASLGCSVNDIIEIDAASNRGIDDIRALREGVLSRPFDSEKKMYIIDEVHMLTKEAFNALLKTLEEPPSHVIFVLATTELHKVLPTIISRCQSFIFKSPSQKVLVQMIEDVCKRESVSLEKGVPEIVAFLGNGSFRDTQGVLQKLISYSADTKINLQEAEQVLGVPTQSLLFGFITSIQERDTDTALVLLRKASSQNIDAHLFLQMITEKIRAILQIRFSQKIDVEMKEVLVDEEYTRLKSFALEAKNINAQTLSEMLFVYSQMNGAFVKYIPLELAIFRLFGNNG